MSQHPCQFDAGGRRSYALLMAAARQPDDIETLALGGVLARFRLQELASSDLQRLLQSYFPGVAPADLRAAEPREAVCTALAAEEFADLFNLLREYRRDDSEETEWVTRAVASACAGNNHLWQDMGLPSREVLSQLIRRHFPALYHKNHSNMKWKKFFYRQLCQRSSMQLCKAPSCGVCTDYELCFGCESGSTS